MAGDADAPNRIKPLHAEQRPPHLLFRRCHFELRTAPMGTNAKTMYLWSVLIVAGVLAWFWFNARL